MYTVLKNKRLRFQIPQPEKEPQGLQSYEQQFQGATNLSDMIVGSCFIDDVLVLFLFNSGRYLIVNTSLFQTLDKNKQIKSTTSESQIVYQGNILNEIEPIQTKKESQLIEQRTNNPPKRLLPKNSLTFIQQSYSKIIFTDCKRIQLNECIVTTKHSVHVFWLKLIRQVVQNNQDFKTSIRVEIIELPATMLGDVLRLDNTHMTLNMTLLTELCEFDNSSETIKRKSKEQGLEDFYNSNNKGSFYIKNQILEDKMVYLTIYTRIPQSIWEKYRKEQQEEEDQCQQVKKVTKLPYFIVTKFQFPIPINEVSSSFIMEVSDKFNNQIAIYKQSGDDENEWEVKLYSFGFDHIEGEELIRSYMKNYKQNKNSQGLSVLAIPNITLIPKPKTIILPQQFTSSINIQQFVRLDQSQQKSHEATYLIVSINQTFVQTDQLTQNQINEQQQGQFYRVNGQIVYLDENGNGRPRQNTKISNYCWTHLCRLAFIQNSDKFTQWIEKTTKYKIPSTSFLKIINVNYHQQLLYVLRLAHQRVNSQLYENKLDLVSIQSGKVVEKGYLSLKNYSFSPNQLTILDVPETFSIQEDFFFHLRLLFDKKSLYAFMIENSKKYFDSINDPTFVQTILSLL